jgi:hypothetical protein
MGIQESMGSRVLGVALISGVAGLVIFGFVWMQQAQQAAAKFDKQTFCPVAGPSVVHAFLIDRTDALNAIQIESLKRNLLRLAEAVPERGALRIYEVGTGAELIKPVVEICNPGTGANASELDSNPEKLKTRYREKYLTPIMRMLEGMGEDREQATSPILEAIQAISVREFGDTGAAGPNSLVIFSDLLQHSEVLNLYGDAPSALDFSRSAMGRGVRADLSRVVVTFYLINRQSASKFQSDAMGLFWLEWIQIQGGQPEWKHLLG